MSERKANGMDTIRVESLPSRTGHTNRTEGLFWAGGKWEPIGLPHGQPTLRPEFFEPSLPRRACGFGSSPQTRVVLDGL